MSAASFSIEGRPSDHDPPRSDAERLSEGRSRAFSVERILCPIDFSEPSRTALRYAIALAAWHDAEIHALHVVEESPIAGPETPALNYISALREAARVEARQRLRDVLEPVGAAGLRATADIRAGDPVKQIVDLALSSRVDVVVIGTRGLHGIKRFVLGSTAEKLLRTAPCPILTVPPHADRTPSWHQVPFSRILCPVDFSERSQNAVELALSMAEEVKGTLTLLHAVDHLVPLASGEQIGLDEQLGYWLRELQQDARDRLRHLIPQDVRARCHAEVVLVVETPARAILQAAKQSNAELIVMSLRPHRRLDRMLAGSTTHAVTREATCPVLTIRNAQRPT